MNKIKRQFILMLESFCCVLDMIPLIRVWNQRANHPLNTFAGYLDARWEIGALKKYGRKFDGNESTM